MQLLGIGPLEFLLIIVVAVIVLGPKGMVQAAQEAGKLIRKIVRSPIWRDIVDTSREIREFPRKIAREAGIEAEIDELRRSARGTYIEINPTRQPLHIDQLQEKPIKPKNQVLKDNQEKSNGADGG